MGLKAIKQSTFIVGADSADGKTFPLLHKKAAIVNDMLWANSQQQLTGNVHTRTDQFHSNLENRLKPKYTLKKTRQQKLILANALKFIR